MSEYAGIVQDELRDLRGNAMVGAVVRVRNVGTTTPATVYNKAVLIASAGGADALVNDVTTGLPAAAGLLLPGVDIAANYTFFADSDSEYDLYVTWQGQTFQYRVRPKVVEEPSGGGGGAAAVELTGNQTAAGDKTWTGRALFPTAGPLIPSATGQSAALKESIRLPYTSMLTSTNKTGKVVNLIGVGLIETGLMPYPNGWLTLGDEALDYIHCLTTFDLGQKNIIDATYIGGTEALIHTKIVQGLPWTVTGFDALTVTIATMPDTGAANLTSLVDRFVVNSGKTVANTKATFKNMGAVELLSDTMLLKFGATGQASLGLFGGGIKATTAGGGLYCNVFQDEGAAGTYFEFAAGKLFVQPRGGSPGLTVGVALAHTGTTVGFNSATPVGKRTLGAAATDAASTQTLANNLRQGLIDLGLGQT